jgi:hypothetical protein
VRTLVHGALLCALLTACQAGTPSASTPSGSSAPSTSPPAAGATVVTFQVGAEQYRIELTDPADIAIARQLLAGEQAPRIPNGRIVRGDDGGVNTGYSWHIDPGSLEFADITTEVCDGLPSYVEDGTLTGDYFCPWSAQVIAVSE